PKTRVLFDHHNPAAGEPPHPPPFFPLPAACWDGDGHLVYTTEQGTATHTVRLDVRTGKGERLSPGKKGPSEEASPAARRLAQARRLTPPGNLFLRERLRAPQEVVRWKSPDGLEIDGILTRPPRGLSKAPSPLVVHPHGGPHSRSVAGFDFTVQVLAAKGYAVFQPNFRGSSGYGQKFIDADRFDFGGGDMRDLLSGIDHLVKEKLVDRDRQYVYGISYGGYMTTWLVGQTQQFEAAVAQNAVTDLNTMWGLTDIQ